MSSYVEAHEVIGIQRGRQDELGDVTPSRLTLTLDNKDGRFTPAFASGAYYPNVRLGRPIRVSAVWPLGGGGTTYRRFTGYIDEWPVSWPDPGAALSTVTVTASSRMARLGRTRPMANVVSQEILADRPYMYFTLGDAAEAAGAANSSGRSTVSAAPVQVGTGGTLVFGTATGPATDGPTALRLDPLSLQDGKLLRASFPDTVFTSTSGYVALEAWVIITLSGTIASVGSSSGFLSLRNSLGDLEVLVDGSAVTPDSILLTNVSPNVDNGALHHVVMTVEPNAGNFRTRLFYDGVQVSTDASSITAAQMNVIGASDAALRIGSAPFNDNDGFFLGDVSIAHVALYDSELTAARVAEHYASGTTGHEGDSSDEWIQRLAFHAGIPTAEVSVETGNTTSVALYDTAGKAPLQAMQDITRTEAGMLFDAGDGTLTFQSRGHRYGATSVLTLDVAAQQVEQGLEPTLDNQNLVNDVTATRPNGVAVRVVNQDSVDDHGVYSDSSEVLTTSDGEVEDYANWQISLYGDPKTRVASCSVQLTVQESALKTSLLALELGDCITLDNLPGQSPATSMDFFVEGITEAVGFEAWMVSLNLSPADDVRGVFIIGHPQYGELRRVPAGVLMGQPLRGHWAACAQVNYKIVTNVAKVVKVAKVV